MGYKAILVFFLTIFFLVVLANNISNLVSPKSDNKTKKEPYKCDVETIENN